MVSMEFQMERSMADGVVVLADAGGPIRVGEPVLRTPPDSMEVK